MRDARRRERGASMLEVLIVLVLLSMTMVLAFTAVSAHMRSTRLRVAADQLVVNLKQARLKAVTTRRTFEVALETDPANSYELIDGQGNVQVVDLPAGVRIVSETASIVFQPNGSIPGAVSTVLETTIREDYAERYIIQTSRIGVSKATRRVLK